MSAGQSNLERLVLQQKELIADLQTALKETRNELASLKGSGTKKQEPAGHDKGPAGHDKGPAGHDKEPAGNDKEPAGNDKEPAGNDKDQDDASSEDQVRKQAARQRLRRMCRPRANGSLAVPQEVYRKYVAGGSEREQLLTLFIKNQCVKEP